MRRAGYVGQEEPTIRPPDSVSVEDGDRKPLLWLPDGRAVVARIGYATGRPRITKRGDRE